MIGFSVHGIALSLILGGVLLVSISCRATEPPTQLPVNSASPSFERTETWSTSDLDELLEDDKKIYRAWKDFEHTLKYRLAEPSHRRLTPAALERVNSNNSNQIKPFLVWWGARGYKGPNFLIVIVVDGSRVDANRYGLVVIAAPESEGSKYKPYWVAREEDMESYLISPASGGVYLECFRRDGTQETKTLVWRRRDRQFRLV